MEVFRVTQAKYATTLYASGWEGRWNRSEERVIYTAASRSLACLENLVHRRGRGLLADFSVMVIYLPDDLRQNRIELNDLPNDWNRVVDVTSCQQQGSSWYQEASGAVLSVPSAVIPTERNLVINTEHSDYRRIRLINTEPFHFDPRLFDKSDK